MYADGVDSNNDINIYEIDTRSLGGIIDALKEKNNDLVCEYYEEYYDITYDNKFGDAKKYGLREIPEARNVYKDIVLDDVPNDPYGENDEVPDMTIRAKVILKGQFSENIDGSSIIEWKIIYTTDPDKNWTATHTGDVKTFGNVFVQLPYLGNYDVEMSVWDVYNHCCKQYTKDAIIVEPYNIDIRGFYFDARPLPDGLKYELIIPQEYQDDVEKEYRYYLWTSNDGDVTKGIVTYKRNPMEMVLSDVVGEYIVDGTNLEGYVGEENLRNATDRENWISIVNTESDGENVLKFSWLYNDDYNNITLYGVDSFNFVGELTDVSFDENDAYNPEWNNDELYHVIKKNVDRMYSWAIQEHLGGKDENSIMRNYQPNGNVSFEGPYYKFDVENILYKAERGYKEYDHLNQEIVNLEPGEHYKYVRYINSVVDIKPLTWILLGFDFTQITGRIINNNYPKWTLTMIGDELDPDEDLRNDKEITTHNGLYFTYLFEEEGIYKIKLELLDINGNKYVIEKPIVIVDKDANYEMYHTLKDEYDKYLEAKNERSLAYLT